MYIYVCRQIDIYHIYRVVKKKVYNVIQRENIGEILKYFLMESFFLYIHIFSRSQSFLSYVEKKLQGSKNPENGLFKKSHSIKKETFFILFLFLLQDNSYSCLVLQFQVPKLKIAIEVTKLSFWPQKCVFFKC